MFILHVVGLSSKPSPPSPEIPGKTSYIPAEGSASESGVNSGQVTPSVLVTTQHFS